MKKIAIFYSFISLFSADARVFLKIKKNIFCPWKYKKIASKVAYLWQFGFFSSAAPDCPKRPKKKNSYWKFVSRHICSLICGFLLADNFVATRVEIHLLFCFFNHKRSIYLQTTKFSKRNVCTYKMWYCLWSISFSITKLDEFRGLIDDCVWSFFI